jgi:hypothetical protein
MKQGQIFRPKGNLAWAIFAFTLNAMFLTQAIAYPSKGSVLAIDLGLGAVFATLAYVLWVRPKLILNDLSLVVVNPFKTVEIAYRDITKLETKWALLLHHSGRKTRVFVAPANGKQRWVGESVQRWTVGKALQPEKTQLEFAPVSQSTTSDSGVVYQMITERIKNLH